MTDIPSEVDAAEVISRLADTIVAFRAAGPVMPETPSEAVISTVLDGSILPGGHLMVRGMYDAIRNALMKEQKSCSGSATPSTF